jgi:hypothetical protein
LLGGLFGWVLALRLFKEEILANWFKEEIAQFGNTVDSSIQKASAEIQDHIEKIGSELNDQRRVTKDDIEGLIRLAALEFGNALDTRVEKAKSEIASLVTEKIAEARGQLSAAADEQKRTAIRNAVVAVFAAIIVGVISLIYKKLFHGEIDLLSIFRAVLVAVGCGQIVWLMQKYVISYLQLSKTKRSVFVVGAQYIGAFRPRGAMAQMLLLVVVLGLWALLNFWPEFSHFITERIP